MNILIVDDDLAHISSLETFLNTEGHRVGRATDGRGALHRMADGLWDVALVQLVMARSNGLTVIGDIRARHPGVRIVAYASFMDGYFAALAAVEGADRCLSSPLKPEAVRRILLEGKSRLPWRSHERQEC